MSSFLCCKVRATRKKSLAVFHSLLSAEMVPIENGVDFIQDAFGNELSYSEFDDELSFLQVYVLLSDGPYA